MYAKEVVRVVEQDGVKYDGKRVTMAPFALIWLSPDGKSAKTVLSDRAVFDLNEPLSLNIESRWQGTQDQTCLDSGERADPRQPRHARTPATT